MKQPKDIETVKHTMCNLKIKWSDLLKINYGRPHYYEYIEGRKEERK